MGRLAPFAALLLAVIVGACSVEGAPPAATATAATPSLGPRATAVPSTGPSVAIVPTLVPCPTRGTPESPLILSAEESLACELASAAEANGTSIEAELERYRTAEIVGEIAERVAEMRPDMFVGSALAEQPGDAPTLYIKGPADDFIRDLVAAAEIEVAIADHQPFSFFELEERQMRLGTALMDIGYSNWAAGSDIETGRLWVSITIEADLPSSTVDLLALLPADLRSGVDVEFSETPVAVDTIED